MRTSQQHRRSRSSVRPQVEHLEDLCLLSVYSVIDLGTLGGTGTAISDINEVGQVVGSFSYAPSQFRAFFWDDGEMTVLPTLGGDSSQAFGVNDAGQVVGTSTVTPGDFNTRHAFLWDSINGIQDLGAFGAVWSSAVDINNAGQIVGSYSWPDRTRAFLWEDGVFRDLFLGSASEINDAGVVAGTWESTRNYPVAATWDPVFGARELGVLPGGVFSFAYGLNDAGQVVGYSESVDVNRAILFDDGQMIDLGTLNPNDGWRYALDINNSGQIIGSAGGAFVMSDGVMQNLNDLMLTGSGLTLATANAINDVGQIAADAVDAQGVHHAVLLNPMPENTPVISINDISVTEGHSGTKAATFTVTLSAAVSQTVTMNYQTATGTASLSDYQIASGTLAFAPGETSQTITVSVNGDRVGEPNETFMVNITGATGALVLDGQGVGTIIDDEPRISISDASVQERNSGTSVMVFTLTLSAAYDVPVTVNFSTADSSAKAGEDYEAKSGTLTFAAGETSKAITIVIKGDKKKEANEAFFINLSGATSAFLQDAQAVGWILDDDRR
jgi:probable HAF family extracellular repeat protein